MSASCTDRMRRMRGFTLTELIAVIVILGILAVFALPKMNTGEYQAYDFRDQVLSALRFAQKSAVSHRRLVCVSFTANSVSLAIAQTNGAAACAYPLNLATGAAAVSSANGSFAPVPANLFIQPDGRITQDAAGTTLAAPTISVATAGNITLEGATGYVN